MPLTLSEHMEQLTEQLKEPVYRIIERFGREYEHGAVITSSLRSLELQAKIYIAFLRSPDEAFKLYRVVSKPAAAGLSWHNPGPDGLAWAVDIDGDPSALAQDLTPPQQRLIEIAEEEGLKSGRPWGDNVHFYVEGFNRRRNYVILMRTLDRTLKA